jgi:signal transduction histidine kinase
MTAAHSASDRPHPAEIEARRASPSRLAAVQRSGLLDSAPEPAFDALTRMAAALLKVPASFVSVVDAERDFYKSQTGFPAALAAARELPGSTFCHHTLGRAAALVIDDTHADPTWRAVPTVDTLGVRAYVGVPLQLDGQTIGSLCVIDMQPRHWSREEIDVLEQIALSAAREIGLRAALQDARDEVARSQSLIRAKEELIAVVVHDLRTVLQVMNLSVAHLQRHSTPTLAPIMKRMTSASAGMRRLADDLLDTHAGAPQRGGARRETILASQLLADTVNIMAPLAARADIGLEVTPPAADAQLSIDYAQLLRVLCNLAGNAIKFSQPGGRVMLAAVRSDGNVQVSVADKGSGIDAADLPRVFERGWQGAEALARSDGSGLGLAIVKALIEANGGLVSVQSTRGQGTTVSLTLPCA